MFRNLLAGPQKERSKAKDRYKTAPQFLEDRGFGICVTDKMEAGGREKNNGWHTVMTRPAAEPCRATSMGADRRDPSADRPGPDDKHSRPQESRNCALGKKVNEGSACKDCEMPSDTRDACKTDCDEDLAPTWEAGR